MILHHQLTISPTRAEEIVPTQMRLIREHRERMERIRAAAAMPVVAKAITVVRLPPTPVAPPRRAALLHRDRELSDRLRRIKGHTAACAAVSEASERYAVTFEDIASDSRFSEVVIARNAAFDLLRVRGFSLTQIARLFGKDHSSVHHGIKCHRGEVVRKRPQPADGPPLSRLRRVALSPGERRVMDVLLDAHPLPLSQGKIAELVWSSHPGGGPLSGVGVIAVHLRRIRKKVRHLGWTAGRVGSRSGVGIYRIEQDQADAA